ncbi:hypothetical protein C4568_03055 [Candidatus Parcubacteria bacterium]|nr:MAG: hypothetical protein C4568_03055 [Candidatus Parcubacteria bacterium]
MFVRIDNRSRVFVTVAIVAFLMVGVFGIFHGMDMSSSEQMSNCPFIMGIAAICNMSPFEHIAAWQNMFASIPQQTTVLTLLLLALSFAFSRLLLFAFPRDGDQEPQRLLYADREPKAIDPLRLALARGIIHPKIF